MNPFAEYRITSPYGPRRSPISGKQEFHTGIDLVKAHRDPIYAFVGGEVIFASEGKPGSGFGGYGIVVAVRCPKTSHLHVYAHLDSAVVKVGQLVERGQMIGRQGSTGQSTGSHLHYEIRKTSSPQYGWIADRANNCFDPTRYLQDLYKAEEEAAKPVQIKPALDPGVAETIIKTWLSPAWFQADERAREMEDAERKAAWIKQRDYYHWLAQQLRKASGLI
ncbi:M23 family metallopeptidase [Paenibacillus senegalensis]|uniref:M23 family metallopeptidase n=1 Tax=Paenibacillus senegalensis TaxID=1465766 RepID=UPI000288E5B2|nr:M23 family metallopeptidase [Paenibacillus senegalensis]